MKYRSLTSLLCGWMLCATVRAEQPTPVARYVFFDTSIVASSKGFTHHMNPAVRLGQVIHPDRPWDAHGVWAWTSVVEYNGRYHLWYDGVGKNGRWGLCYAVSDDGLRWTKPSLGLIEYEGSKANNIVYLGRPGGNYHGGTVLFDPAGDPNTRFKFVHGGGPNISTHGHLGIDAAASPDGIHFTPAPNCPIAPWYTDTGNVAFWDSQRSSYILYVRYWTAGFHLKEGKLTLTFPLGKRAIGRCESKDFFHFPEPQLVLAPDESDPPDFEMYNSAAHKYPWARDTYLTFPSGFYTQPDTVDVQIATSTDGIRWRRDHREPWLRTGQKGQFDSMEIYLGTGMLRRDGDILMYYGGFNVPHGKSNFGPGMGGIGCSRVRMDGFFSMDAAYAGGELVTRPVRVEGRTLRANVDASAGGSFRVELLDEASRPIPGFTLGEATGVYGNRIDHPVAWKKGGDVSALSGQSVRLRIVARDCKLYAFEWK